MINIYCGGTYVDKTVNVCPHCRGELTPSYVQSAMKGYTNTSMYNNGV